METSDILAADQSKAPPARPASTILLVRDGAAGGLEVFMVKRHHAIDFASGALVFPGGKLAEGDSDPALATHCTDGGATMDDRSRGMMVAGIREAFEESGLLLARAKGESALLDADRAHALAPWRPKLDKGEETMRAFAEAEGLDFALDALVPFAHWVTPTFMPKRFDTAFYIAHAPEGQIGRHDGSESVDSLWITPSEALKGAEEGRFAMVVATRLNVELLGRAATADEAIARARARPIVTVEPVLDKEAPGGAVLRIPAEAGYGISEVKVDRIVK
ncbi:hypothetical protein ACFOGJ_07885 [Marinibaculum pumilum]|uniref:Nudix hydrolase domain-containing protein n=1 Tax=Marinibaculum pumilum TaxID=1766165 RepID=A0ABV7KXN4_9PROT